MCMSIGKIEMCAGTHSRSETSTDKWKNESQRTSGKTNRNGQVEKLIATDKWKNESQRTSGKTNRNGKWKNKLQRTSDKTT